MKRMIFCLLGTLIFSAELSASPFSLSVEQLLVLEDVSIPFGGESVVTEIVEDGNGVLLTADMGSTQFGKTALRRIMEPEQRNFDSLGFDSYELEFEVLAAPNGITVFPFVQTGNDFNFSQGGQIDADEGDAFITGVDFVRDGIGGTDLIQIIGFQLFSKAFAEANPAPQTITLRISPTVGQFEAVQINGSGQTYFEDFDSIETTFNYPQGWKGENNSGTSQVINSLGLVDGPLTSPDAPVDGIVNVGGNADRFTSSGGGRLATWKDDLDGNGSLGEGDVIMDASVDRALGNARVGSSDSGSLALEIEITDKPLRAFVAEWDLEIWGGDPEAAFRGEDGGGYATEITVGGTSYHSQTVTLKPGDLFDTSFDLGPNVNVDPTLIDGNEHSVRGNTSGIVEVNDVDGAVGNTVLWNFNADHAGEDGGWIQAVDNVLFRALAAGDAQGDGDVDPADLIQLLAGGAFGQGNIDATWGQGDFDNDGDFDGTDILAVVQGLAGEFPKTYAHDPSNGVPDVLINPATGNITLDTNGTTIGSIVMDSVAGIFNGPNSPSWDAPGDFAADIDTQISMPISFTNPGYTGVDDLGDGIIGDLPPGFDILADLTIKYLDPNGDLLDGEAHIVPEPSSMVLATFGILATLCYIWRSRRS